LDADHPSNGVLFPRRNTVASGGAVKAAVTTTLMSGAEGVAAMKKAATVAKSYKPAR
jgi:hypothetical protein